MLVQWRIAFETMRAKDKEKLKIDEKQTEKVCKVQVLSGEGKERKKS